MAANAMTASPTHNRMAELREQAGKLGEDVREMAATGGKVATDQLETLETYVRNQPMKSLLLAAGVGALFGFFFLRR